MSEIDENGVLTFFRKGKLRKIFLTDKKSLHKELDLAEAVNILECDEKTKPCSIDKQFYEFLEKNKEAFDFVFEIEEGRIESRGRGNEYKIINKIKTIIRSPELSDEQKDYLSDVIQLLAEGGMAKATTKKLAKSIIQVREIDPIKILAHLKDTIPDEYFEKNPINSADISGPKEVILSEYLIGGH